MTPYETLKGEKPNVANLRSFGCTVYTHIPKDERKKLDPKSRKCIFLGYGDCVKGYRLYDVSREKVIHSRDVIFNESRFDGMKEEHYVERESTEVEDEPIETDERGAEVPAVQDDPVVDQGLRRSGRQRKAPDLYGEWATVAGLKEPKNYQEAMSTDKVKWRAAMETEFVSLQKNEVWDLVRLPGGFKAIGSKWVFKTKVTPEGSIERHKARLVAQGFNQKYGMDYDETCSPVVRSESVRTVITLAAKKKLLVHQMDVTTAFLNGMLEEEVYMKQPEGFEQKGQEDLVCRLKKSIYGLKQSPRCWNAVLDQHLKSNNLKQSSADPCIYTSTEGETVIVAVYVDDILITTEKEKTMRKINKLISERFEVKDLGILNSFLGVQVKMTSEGIWIGQSGYTKRVLDKFEMAETKPVFTPVDVSQNLNSESTDSVDKSFYQSAVGSLLYLLNWTRPDITFAVNNVARFTCNPTKEHWTAVKRVLRYLKGTIDYGITYTRDSKDNLVGYCDADWAGDVNDRKSTSGYVFTLAGAPVSWRSKKQTCVALSTAEAEYVALASAAQEAVWLRELIHQLDGPSKEATIMYDDSQSAIAMTKNPQFHGRSKHIAIKYHYIRGEVEKGTVRLVYCQTTDMLADILTKGWLVEWGFYALSASKAIFRARTYNCNLFSPVMIIT